jgi:Zn-finger nucleic acid-binding protein
MQQLFVAAKDGGTDVEVDRCAECGALWFDPGELEIIAELLARPVGGGSANPCPACREPMSLARVKGNLPAEKCAVCLGTFLSRATVLQLEALRLPRPPDARAQPPEVGFLCARCGGRFPYAQGNGTSLGLVCPGCVVNPRTGHLAPGERGTLGGEFERQVNVGAWGLAELLGSVFDFFG